MSKKLIYLISFVLVLGLAAGLCSAQSVNINFQSKTRGDGAVPDGYLPDYGEVFANRGNGFSYGWQVHNTGGAWDRNSTNAPDQRYDTLNLMQQGVDKIWEIALDNDIYDLFIVFGDPSRKKQTNNFDVEGTILTDPDPATEPARDYDEFELTVAVSDGRLTIKPAEGASSCRIMFVDIILVTAARMADPADEATDVPRDVVLNWTAGKYAPPINGHLVYFSESFNDVNDRIGGIAQDAGSYTPAQRLDFDKTYYWRVDEVNAPPDSTVYEGNVWRFTTEPPGHAIENVTATASSSRGSRPENTVNGSGLDDSGLLHGRGSHDMWLSGPTGPQPTWIDLSWTRFTNSTRCGYGTLMRVSSRGSV